MRVRRLIAIWAAKLVSTGCKLSGRQGVTFAGKIALKIDPKILGDLASQVREKIFVVCGTNGKTTTNNLLCAAVESEGKKLVCNHTGSNMLAGVAAAFVLAAKNNGKLDADYACIEIDEASTLRTFPHFKPDFMVLTNLFRDQLDRYGEIDTTMDMLKRAMQMAPDMTVIVNGDDALSSYLAMESHNPYKTYGITEQVFESHSEHEIREGRFCKKCGARLEYEFYHYSQIGKYDCPNCDFTRPPIDFEASAIDMTDGLQFDVEGRHIAANYRGFYNIYNILAAYSAARTAGMKLENFDQVLQSFHPQNGRMEHFEINGTEVLLNLAKNPAGFNQNISAVMEDEKEKDIIIVINDNAQDGTDISWLWDVDFDRFSDPSIRSVTVSGIRCEDMRLRMKYVDIESELIADVKSAIEARIGDGCKNLYVLVNYTALFSTRNLLAEMQKK
ncbi:Mur ligase family protein [Parablautia sp. Marseille-Q6255]|uniref:Mur ligase family protein n=1 Tax=Parablautia sp. Marseille-Q6255 TaxID=3039593 RepID=UPI0024BC92F7|nr:Mur ligase family protein [Parablautia sp. Marseille-Q6255]